MADERLNIVFKSSEGGDAEVELPLKLLFVGDYMGRDDRPVEDRLPVRVDRGSFPRVLAALGPRFEQVVTPASSEGTAVAVSLRFGSLADFGPDGVANQIPHVQTLLALRDALTEAKQSGDVAELRRRLEVVLPDEATRQPWLALLGLDARAT